MRRILITDRIKALAKEYADKMEDASTFKQGSSPKDKLLELARKLKKASTIIFIPKSTTIKGRNIQYDKKHGKDYALLTDYVMVIHDNYVGLNNLLPSEYENGILKKIDNVLVSYGINDISKIWVKFRKKKIRPFFELVVEAMQYKNVQKDILPFYIKRLGVKTCVYCNAQFATTATLQELKIIKRKPVIVNEEAACYELDHNKPKSKYPCLCTNFYNLQPSCGSCNRRKNDRDLDFSLYYEEGEKNINPLHFVLDEYDIINFRKTNKGKGIKPYLCNIGNDVPPSISDNISIAGKFNNMLGIQGIYDEFNDVVEEILWKHKIYSSGFMESAINQMASLGLEGFDINRFILDGYYDGEEDFLKRPLSIMKKDIWDQLNTI